MAELVSVVVLVSEVELVTSVELVIDLVVGEDEAESVLSTHLPFLRIL
jgi:hypothetical protein